MDGVPGVYEITTPTFNTTDGKTVMEVTIKWKTNDYIPVVVLGNNGAYIIAIGGPNYNGYGNMSVAHSKNGSYGASPSLLSVASGDEIKLTISPTWKNCSSISIYYTQKESWL